MAIQQITPSRRQLLTAAAALASPLAAVPALAAVTVSSFSEPHPDAALLDLCRRCRAESDRIDSGVEDMDDDTSDAACRVLAVMEKEAAAMVPVTLAGLAAKARLVREALFGGIAPGHHDGALLNGLFDGIDAMAREAAHV